MNTTRMKITVIHSDANKEHFILISKFLFITEVEIYTTVIQLNVSNLLVDVN